MLDRYERGVIKLLLHPEIRKKVKKSLTPEMFFHETYREFFKILAQDIFDDLPQNFNLLSSSLVDNGSGNLNIKLLELRSLTDEFVSLSDAEIRAGISIIADFVKERLLSQAVNLWKGGDTNSKSWELIKSALQTDLQSDCPVYDISQSETVKSLHHQEFPEGTSTSIRSYFQLINLYTTYSGFKLGDLALYVAAPGGGKTTSLVCEGACSLRQGLKVYHIFIGDMSGFDAYTKYVAHFQSTNILNVITNPAQYLEDSETKSLLENLRISIHPAFKYSAEQIVAQCKGLKKTFDFDVVILDYDSNVAKISSESMYSDGALSYGLYKGFAMEHRCVWIVASQPKPQYWGTEVLPMESANESSRKQHVVDIMVTFGVREGSSQLGSMHLAKCRRGEPGKTMRIKREGAMSKLTEISGIEYDRLSLEEKKKSTQTDVVL